MVVCHTKRRPSMVSPSIFVVNLWVWSDHVDIGGRFALVQVELSTVGLSPGLTAQTVRLQIVLCSLSSLCLFHTKSPCIRKTIKRTIMRYK